MVVTCTATSAVRAEPLTALAAGPAGNIEFRSYTPASQTPFLNRSYLKEPPVVVNGELTLPKQATLERSGKSPAVVVAHGTAATSRSGSSFGRKGVHTWPHCTPLSATCCRSRSRSSRPRWRWRRALVAAVANAGGLGMLGLANRDADGIRRVIMETRRLTDRPFGVNFLLRAHEETDARLAACLEVGVPVVSFHWDDASPYISRVHASGALVMYTVGSAAEARRAVDAGVDVVVAQGWEAGGHVRGEVATLPLIPRVVDAVTPTPVVAAGGIADGRGLAAALTLGAVGVWMGTRFMMSAEAG